MALFTEEEVRSAARFLEENPDLARTFTEYAASVDPNEPD
jgi:hypothetical protein